MVFLLTKVFKVIVYEVFGGFDFFEMYSNSLFANKKQILSNIDSDKSYLCFIFWLILIWSTLAILNQTSFDNEDKS